MASSSSRLIPRLGIAAEDIRTQLSRAGLFDRHSWAFVADSAGYVWWWGFGCYLLRAEPLPAAHDLQRQVHRLQHARLRTLTTYTPHTPHSTRG